MATAAHAAPREVVPFDEKAAATGAGAFLPTGTGSPSIANTSPCLPLGAGSACSSNSTA
jgi:hypothetical protein